MEENNNRCCSNSCNPCGFLSNLCGGGSGSCTWIIIIIAIIILFCCCSNKSDTCRNTDDLI